jgi:4-deoxy-L-threo-5-hexosulose-uronate ketol-isomerase
MMKSQENPMKAAVAALSTEELRRAFLVQDMFRPGEAKLRWWDTDRTVMGAVSPLGDELELANPPEMRSAFFLERRELGVINIGGAGAVTVDGTRHAMAPCDALYVGRGAKSVRFGGASAASPARYWLVSYPAHASHPVRHVPFAGAKGEALGGPEGSNSRTLYRLIWPATVETCQLVMGFTRLSVGSVWNTMPPHTHLRRSEVYLYFDLPSGQSVFHFMGEPSETRHLVVRDCEAVLSPPWSIHCGVGTGAYAFIWCMGGENRDYTDMDPAPLAGLR